MLFQKIMQLVNKLIKEIPVRYENHLITNKKKTV